MTFTQIEKTNEFMHKLGTIHGFEEMDSFVGELKAFYFMFDVSLEVFVHNTIESYTKSCEQKDKASIKSFLDGQIAENDNNRKVLDVLNLIDEGRSSIRNKEQMARFVSKAYYAYSSEIKFDKTTEAAATAPSDAFNIGLVQVDENMVNGVISKLNNYGMSIVSQSSAAKTKTNTSVVINNNNSNSATASANADIKITIEQAKQQVEDAGFGNEQYKAIMDKLAEIESIGNSNESKGCKWKKAKEILKWCAEQGIEVAKIILPLLPQMFNKS